MIAREPVEAIAMKPGGPSPQQRKRAIATGLVLAAIAVGIYAFVLYRYITR